MPFKSKQQAKFMFAKHPKIAKEFAKKTKSIKKLPIKVSGSSKNVLKTKLNDNITLFLSDILGTDDKWYKALSAGTIHSRKYNGIWDADPAVYKCELGAGKIEIKQNFIEAIYNNFKNMVNETIPFIDIDHEAGISAGPILDCKIEESALWIKPQWNDIGKKSVGEKNYMYLSLGIESHKNSKTGLVSFPVMTTASLTNIPVDKDQDILELSEKKSLTKVNKKDSKIIKTGGTKMTLDEIITSITELSASIKGAIEADETGAYKAAIGAMIDNLEVSCGLATSEEEADEGKEEEVKAEEMKDKPAIPAGEAVDTNKAPAKTQMSDSPEFIALSDKIKKLEKENQEKNIQLKDSIFTQKYLGKKILPAQKASFFRLFLKDEVEMTKILDGMPKLNLTDELGTSDDISGEVVKDSATARKIFDSKVLELSDKEKVDSLVIAERVKKEQPDLYRMAYPGAKN